MTRAAPLLAAALLSLPTAGCPRTPPAMDASSGLGGAVQAHAGARSALEDAAADLDPGVRARALAVLVQTSAEAGGGTWARRGTYDPSPWVQRAVLQALAARAHDPLAAEHLHETVGRSGLSPYVRCGAALRLRDRPTDGLKATVLDIESSQTAGWQAAPCTLAAATLGDPDAAGRLDAILREGDLPLDIGFIDDIGRSGLTSLAPALVEAADLVEEPLRPAIGAALLLLGAPEGESLLREGLSDPSPEAPLEVLDYLAEIDAPTATAMLKRASASATGDARTYAQLILMGRGASDSRVAEQAAVDDDREMRALALRHLGDAVRTQRATEPDRKLEKRALEMMRVGMTDPDDPVREAAAVGLGALGGRSAQADLEQLLGDDNARVRVEAARALLTGPAPRS